MADKTALASAQCATHLQLAGKQGPVSPVVSLVYSAVTIKQLDHKNIPLKQSHQSTIRDFCIRESQSQAILHWECKHCVCPNFTYITEGFDSSVKKAARKL